MKIIDTSTYQPVGNSETLWVYNGLDCCVTKEVLEVIEPMLDEVTRKTYDFSMALCAPILEMNMRGVLIDEVSRQSLIRDYERDLKRIQAQLGRILTEGVGLTEYLNPNSPAQLIHLFYTVLRIPPIRKRNTKGQYVPTVNRDALERLENYFHARAIVKHLLKIRELSKRLGTLRTSIDRDQRIRTSYNIAGTTTGRLSSSLSDFGTGTNLQNIEPRLRRIFIADPGYKFANIDLEQADARGVAAILWNLFGDDSFLKAFDTGDLHTYVCRLAWRDLPWTGDIKADREIADQPAYRHLSYRDLAKKLGHGTNYLGTPPTMAKHTKLERALIEDFQRRYFGAFPNIQRWHIHVRSTLLQRGFITTLLGRKRWFFGRRNDDATVREAVAYEPQSITSDTINEGLLKVWRHVPEVQLLLQVHDSILIQYPESQEDTLLPRVLECLRIERRLAGDRPFTIPAEAQVGWNWDKQEQDKQGNCIGNPDGLIKWKGPGSDNRRRQEAPTGILDTVI